MASDRLSRIAQQLRDASTWVAGPRQRKLIGIADELEEIAKGENSYEVYSDGNRDAGESGGEPDPAA